MIVLEILIAGMAVLVLLPAAVLFLQVLMALPAPRGPQVLRGRRPSVAVLVPAHDEAPGISAALGSIVPQLGEEDRLLVIADNCADATAAIAAAAGAETVERKDPQRRGKGYALDFGVRHLERDPPEVVIVIDGDCQVDAGTIDRLARVCAQTGRPVQARYVLRAPEGAGLHARIAEFASLVKNLVRPLGYQRLGLPCQLMGTGMAFPWRSISSAALANGHIVEDLMLGISLARRGTAPLFCTEAVVTSFFPRSAEGMREQRTRWEHGHLGMILGDGPGLFVEAIARGDLKLMALILDLCVPPLALLMLFAAASLGSATAFLVVSGALLPFGLALASVAVLGASVLLAWARYGRPIISLRNLAFAPTYALWKIPLYIRFLAGKQVEWVRSKRDEH